MQVLAKHLFCTVSATVCLGSVVLFPRCPVDSKRHTHIHTRISTRALARTLFQAHSSYLQSLRRWLPHISRVWGFLRPCSSLFSVRSPAHICSPPRLSSLPSFSPHCSVMKDVFAPPGCGDSADHQGALPAPPPRAAFTWSGKSKLRSHKRCQSVVWGGSSRLVCWNIV